MEATPSAMSSTCLPSFLRVVRDVPSVLAAPFVIEEMRKGQ